MKQQHKFSSGQQQEHIEARTARTAVKEFESVEELLRHDAAQTTVPPEIAQRLQQAAVETGTPKRPWWRKLLG
jgi:hypothetical protein